MVYADDSERHCAVALSGKPYCACALGRGYCWPIDEAGHALNEARFAARCAREAAGDEIDVIKAHGGRREDKLLHLTEVLVGIYGGPRYEQTRRQEITAREIRNYDERRERLVGKPARSREEVMRVAGYVRLDTTSVLVQHWNRMTPMLGPRNGKTLLAKASATAVERVMTVLGLIRKA